MEHPAHFRRRAGSYPSRPGESTPLAAGGPLPLPPAPGAGGAPSSRSGSRRRARAGSAPPGAANRSSPCQTAIPRRRSGARARRRRRRGPLGSPVVPTVPDGRSRPPASMSAGRSPASFCVFQSSNFGAPAPRAGRTSPVLRQAIFRSRPRHGRARPPPLPEPVPRRPHGHSPPGRCGPVCSSI